MMKISTAFVSVALCCSCGFGEDAKIPSLNIVADNIAPSGWSISCISWDKQPYGWEQLQTTGMVFGVAISLESQTMVRGSHRESSKERVTIYVMPKEFSVTRPHETPEDGSIFLGEVKHGARIFCKVWTEIKTWPEWRKCVEKQLNIAPNNPAHATGKPAPDR